MGKTSVDWEAIERDYRAGIKTLRQIADENGISHVAINKRAKRDGWSRDLSAKIASKADDLVTKEMVTKLVTSKTRISENQIIEANARAIVDVVRSHRSQIHRGLAIVQSLFDELESQTADKALYHQLGDLLYAPDDKGVDKLNEIYRKAMSLPSRADTAKKLVETLKNLVSVEREAFNIKPVEPTTEDGLAIFIQRVTKSSQLPINSTSTVITDADD